MTWVLHILAIAGVLFVYIGIVPSVKQYYVDSEIEWPTTTERMFQISGVLVWHSHPVVALLAGGDFVIALHACNKRYQFRRVTTFWFSSVLFIAIFLSGWALIASYLPMVEVTWDLA